MKVKASVKKHPDCILVRRKGKLFRKSKGNKNPRLNERQG